MFYFSKKTQLTIKFAINRKKNTVKLQLQESIIRYWFEENYAAPL